MAVGSNRFGLPAPAAFVGLGGGQFFFGDFVVVDVVGGSRLYSAYRERILALFFLPFVRVCSYSLGSRLLSAPFPAFLCLLQHPFI